MTLAVEDQIPGLMHPTTTMGTKKGWAQARLYTFSGLVSHGLSYLVLSSRISYFPYVYFILLSRRR